MPERRVPDRDQMLSYASRGLTQVQIADDWAEKTGVRVTRNAISLAMRRYKIRPANPQNRYSVLIPWRVRTEHLAAYDAKMLRLEARRRLGLRNGADWNKRVDSWLKQLEDTGAVVYYDPDTPQGWWHVRREPYDQDIIRRPE